MFRGRRRLQRAGGLRDPRPRRELDGDERGPASTLVFGLAFDDPARELLFAAAESRPFCFRRCSGAWQSVLGPNTPLTTYWDIRKDFGVPNGTLAEGPPGPPIRLTGEVLTPETPRFHRLSSRDREGIESAL